MAAIRSENLNIRISPEDRELIRRAADACGKQVSSFVIESVIDEAQRILLDQRFLRLPGDVFDHVSEIVDQPPKVHPELVELFRDDPKGE